MRLKEWLKENGITQEWFRKQLANPPKSAHFSLIVNHKRPISIERAVEIKKLTRNQVKPEDWVS